MVCDLLVLPDVRLVTLIGPPGVGKTRLCVAVAQRMSGGLVDAVAFVPLAGLTTTEGVGPAIAQAIGIVEPANRSLGQSLAEHLRGGSLLLILDNLEHLLASAHLLSELPSACRGLTILVTSRIPTRLSGERAVLVHPLDLPTLPDLPPVDLLPDVPSMALFIERAQAARPDFVLTATNARSVAEICVRLDGLPLAIELAAARIRVMTSQELLDRLIRALPLLTRAPANLTPRHRTLRDAIAWSYDLLQPDEQSLFCRLAVFAGGWTLHAAEAVCGPANNPGSPRAVHLTPVAVLDGLTTLAEHSLVELDPMSTEESRFRMLQTIREYGLERLEASNSATNALSDVEELRWRHAAYFLELAEHAEPHLVGRQQVAHLDRLEADLDNIREALEWSRAGTIGNAAELGLRLATALWRFWELRGHVTEGWHYLDDLLARQPEPTVARAQALNVTGYLAWLRGDLDQSRALAQECLSLGRQVADTVALGWGLIGSGILAFGGRDLDQATRLLDEALATVGPDGHYHSRITALYWRSEVARAGGDDEGAEALLDDASRLARTHEDVWILAFMLLTRACLQLERGVVEGAPALLAESLTLRLEIGDFLGVVGCIEGLGWASAVLGDARRAARFFGAAEALRETMGATHLPGQRDNYDRAIAMARTQLDDVSFRAAWLGGQALTRDQVINEILSSEADVAPEVPSAAPSSVSTSAAVPAWPSAGAPRISVLTPREREVAALIGLGLTSRNIAERLVISERTADSHAEHIRQKLALRSRAQIAAWAVEHGLTPPLSN